MHKDGNPRNASSSSPLNQLYLTALLFALDARLRPLQYIQGQRTLDVVMMGPHIHMWEHVQWLQMCKGPSLIAGNKSHTVSVRKVPKPGIGFQVED